MINADSGIFVRAAAALTAAFGSLLSSIVVPTAAITVYAVNNPEPHAVAMFATSVAEPLGLLSATAATYGVSRFFVRRVTGGRVLVPWLAGGAAAAILGAATWTFDFDWWTAAAALLLPAAALVAGRRYATPGAGNQFARPAAPAALNPRPPGDAATARARESAAR